MQEILIALIAGFAAGSMAALVVIDTKTAGMMNMLKTLREMIENVEKMAVNNTKAIETHTQAVGLLKHAGEIIVSEQSKDRKTFIECINNLWHEVDALKPAKQPAPVPDQKSTKAKAKKKPEGKQGND